MIAERTILRKLTDLIGSLCDFIVDSEIKEHQLYFPGYFDNLVDD